LYEIGASEGWGSEDVMDCVDKGAACVKNFTGSGDRLEIIHVELEETSKSGGLSSIGVEFL
jgi:hypothetical protein